MCICDSIIIPRIGLEYPSEKEFYTCQWKWSKWIYFFFRIFCACYTIFVLAMASIFWKHPDRSMYEYCTFWLYTLLVFYAQVAMVTTFYCHYTYREEVRYLERYLIDIPTYGEQIPDRSYQTIKDESDRKISGCECSTTYPVTDVLPWYLKLIWLLSNMIQAGSISITILYFTCLHNPSKPETLISINVHLFNTVLVLLDVALNARPIKIFHFIYCQLFAAVYIAFIVIFWAFDHVHNVVYPFLDWNTPKRAIGASLLVLYIVIPSSHLLLFILYRLRLWIFVRVYGHEYGTDPPEDS